MDNRPVGIFDSGFGGLTSLKALREMMPDENIIYFGDTGRNPYGVRPQEELRRMARQDMELACDEAVLAGRDMAYRRAYGAAVLDVLASARRRRISALTTGFASGAGETRRRFAEMLSLRKKRRGGCRDRIFARCVIFSRTGGST